MFQPIASRRHAPPPQRLWRKLTTFATNAINAGFNLPHGTAPGAPVNGDLWSTISGLFARINGVTGTVLFANITANLTAGSTFTPYNAGTFSNGTFTPNAANGNHQIATGNGAFTIAAPAADGDIEIDILNGASAGSITMSGFTVGSNTGDTPDTTNGHISKLMIRRNNGVSTYLWKNLY